MAVARWVVLSLALVLAAADTVLPLSRTRRNVTYIVFPDQLPRETEPEAPVLQLPESLDLNDMDRESLSLINSIDNITSFANLFGLDLPQSSIINVRSGDVRIVERAKFAKCKPEMRKVRLDLPEEASTMFYPEFIRLERCGGCCHSEPRLTCRPTKVSVEYRKVLKTVVTANSVSTRSRRRRPQRESSSYHEVEVEKHVKCECVCNVQKQDCDPDIHTYLEGECACVCKNKTEKATCDQQRHKYWDNDTCNCYCRRPVACSTGESFSHVSCRCEK